VGCINLVGPYPPLGVSELTEFWLALKDYHLRPGAMKMKPCRFCSQADLFGAARTVRCETSSLRGRRRTFRGREPVARVRSGRPVRFDLEPFPSQTIQVGSKGEETMRQVPGRAHADDPVATDDAGCTRARARDGNALDHHQGG